MGRKGGGAGRVAHIAHSRLKGSEVGLENWPRGNWEGDRVSAYNHTPRLGEGTVRLRLRIIMPREIHFGTHTHPLGAEVLFPVKEQTKCEVGLELGREPAINCGIIIIF